MPEHHRREPDTMHPTCTICTHPLRPDTAHRTTCTRCEHRIRAHLRELPLHQPLLRALLRPDASPRTGTIHGGRAHAPLPVRADVISLIGPAPRGTVRDHTDDQAGPRPLLATLRAWTDVIVEERDVDGPPPGAGLPDLVRWLSAHLPYALQQPWAAALHDELRNAVHRCRNITRTEPRRRSLPAPCPGCLAFGLVEEDWQTYIDCEVCGRLLTRDEYDQHAATVLPALARTALALVVHAS
ncbi:hypothetical protein [Streptomyces sp. WMMC897]|uniref:hypothetical protein n=1 Tax=Streptomyces sp. WMMC897 TaxID=3014782 RepID=UPI0022B6E566|nr:hypothetical protein [Streptomyces sp. WMMC897]MCZ7414296.1 hypothetical protein [Streptomyces sp. WMMC897]